MVTETWQADDERRARMARLGRRDTAPELALRRLLHRRGRRFFVDRRISQRTRARPDLVLPRPRSVGTDCQRFVLEIRLSRAALTRRWPTSTQADMLPERRGPRARTPVERSAGAPLRR
ncbi:hypothetical protein DEI86_02310 [Curtobacterium sp. MCBD17_028]|nr:hypothetical protein DEI86_02310 [Curtobacterium sp. MCBD17_028]